MSNPCQNEGKCNELQINLCTCKGGYTGKFCNEGKGWFIYCISSNIRFVWLLISKVLPSKSFMGQGTNAVLAVSLIISYYIILYYIISYYIILYYIILYYIILYYIILYYIILYYIILYYIILYYIILYYIILYYIILYYIILYYIILYYIILYYIILYYIILYYIILSCSSNENCINEINKYSCTCKPGYSGDNCENDMRL